MQEISLFPINQLQYEEEIWQPLDRFPDNGDARLWYNWLQDPTSLTARLEKIASLRIKPLAQFWHEPRDSEAQCLEIGVNDRVWIRESVLICGDKPCVYGRSVIPSATMENYHEHFQNLHEQSMGNVLFTDPTMVRGPFEFTRLHLSNQPLLAEPDKITEPVWARRSVFSLSSQPLLVTEIFLPAILQYGWNHTYTEQKHG